MPTLLRDVRSGFRALRAAPLTTAAAVLVIALGVGANTAVLAVTYGILIRPLPYRDASRLAILSVATPDGSDFGVPLDQVDEWRRRLRTVESLAGYSTGELRVESAGEPRLVEAAYVTNTFFEVLGVDPVRGRLQSFQDSPDVVILSDRLAAHQTSSGGLTVGDCVGVSARVILEISNVSTCP
jgi:putative ABC transport system permease protein